MILELDLIKGSVDAKTGNIKMKGVASTSNRDLQGQILLPSGFIYDVFLERGKINWNHQTNNNPLASWIGRPINAEVDKEKELFIIEFELFGNNKIAQQVIELANILAEQGLKLGLSIEGKAQEKDKENENIITKTFITGCAITPFPINQNTTAELIKSNNLDNLDLSEIEEKSNKIVKIENVNLNIDINDLRSMLNKNKKMENKNKNFSDEDLKKSIEDIIGKELDEDLFKGMISGKVEEGKKDSKKEDLKKAYDDKKKELEDLEKAMKDYDDEDGEKPGEPKGHSDKTGEAGRGRPDKDEKVSKSVSKDDVSPKTEDELSKGFSHLEDVVKGLYSNFNTEIEKTKTYNEDLIKSVVTELSKSNSQKFEGIGNAMAGIYGTLKGISEKINGLESTPNEPKSVSSESFVKKSIDSAEGIVDETIPEKTDIDEKIFKMKDEITSYLDSKHEEEVSKGLPGYGNEYITTLLGFRQSKFEGLADFQKKIIKEAIEKIESK